MTNMLRKAKGRPMASDNQPQKRRPAPLKIEMTMTITEATPAATWVNDCASGEATEMRAAPAVTFSARISHRTYHLGRRNASGSVYSRTERFVICRTEGVQPAGAYPSGAVRKNCAAATTTTR